MFSLFKKNVDEKDMIRNMCKTIKKEKDITNHMFITRIFDEVAHSITNNKRKKRSNKRDMVSIITDAVKDQKDFQYLTLKEKADIVLKRIK